jgi:BioD-like phosphotransacetylase family protein
MKNLLITSSFSAIGKTVFSLALAIRLKKEGYKVGYFKPISDTREDSDAIKAKELLQMPEDIKMINPAIISEYDYDMSEKQTDKMKTRILEAYNNLKANYDFLIIENCKSLNYLALLKLSSRELAQILDAEVLFLVSGKSGEDIDEFLLGISYFNDCDISPVGGILTLVPMEIIEQFKSVICPRLETHGVKVFGIIPDKSQLTAPTVEEIASVLNARFLAGEDYGSKLVEDFLVGAMEPTAALKYFRKSIRKAVITGGDRPALALAAMETDTSCIILTGGIYPPASVLAKAEETKIPVLLAGGNTYEVVRKITVKPVKGILQPDQQDKLSEWDKIMDEINYKPILERLKE